MLVADKGLKGTANILNFNVGDGLADVLPTPFWSRLQGRFGTSRYWREQGEDVLCCAEAVVRRASILSWTGRLAAGASARVEARPLSRR